MTEPTREIIHVTKLTRGVVISVTGDMFKAVVFPLFSHESRIKEFYISEVVTNERSLIELGAIFYTYSGHVDSTSGRMQVERLSFKWLPFTVEIDN